jgi:hypothetical protein
MANLLGTIVSDLAKAGNAVKSFFEKTAADAPAIVATVTADEGKIAPVIEAFVPGSATAFNLAMKLLDGAAQVVEDAGEAAGANALNVTLDTQTVSDLKTVIAAAKAASLPSSPAPAPIAKSA